MIMGKGNFSHSCPIMLHTICSTSSSDSSSSRSLAPPCLVLVCPLRKHANCPGKSSFSILSPIDHFFTLYACPWSLHTRCSTSAVRGVVLTWSLQSTGSSWSPDSWRPSSALQLPSLGVCEGFNLGCSLGCRVDCLASAARGCAITWSFRTAGSSWSSDSWLASSALLLLLHGLRGLLYPLATNWSSGNPHLDCPGR